MIGEYCRKKVAPLDNKYEISVDPTAPNRSLHHINCNFSSLNTYCARAVATALCGNGDNDHTSAFTIEMKL